MPTRKEDEDLYAVLGIPATATAAEITAAYRALARQVHPDVSPESGRRMVQVNHAYWVLRDPARRRRYDTAHGRRAPSVASPPPASPAPVVDERPWATTDLNAYYEHWRQMLEEERRLWENLVKSRGPGHSESPYLRQELTRAISAQRALENDWRAQHGLPPLSATEWERERAHEIKVASRPATGCLSVLPAGLMIGVWAHRLHLTDRPTRRGNRD